MFLSLFVSQILYFYFYKFRLGATRYSKIFKTCFLIFEQKFKTFGLTYI